MTPGNSSLAQQFLFDLTRACGQPWAFLQQRGGYSSALQRMQMQQLHTPQSTSCPQAPPDTEAVYS